MLDERDAELLEYLEADPHLEAFALQHELDRAFEAVRAVDDDAPTMPVHFAPGLERKRA